MTDSALSKLVDACLKVAVSTPDEGLRGGIYEIEGMSGRRYRQFINLLLRGIDNPAYLEVGVWRGSTLCSAIYQNERVRAVAIDNWSQFGGPKEDFQKNLDAFKPVEAEVRVLEQNFREVNFAGIGQFNVYMFDGPHSKKDQFDGIEVALPALEPEFVLIIDDWNWKDVRDGTWMAIKGLSLEVVSMKEIRTTGDDSHPAVAGQASHWHNGYMIAVLKKKPPYILYAIPFHFKMERLRYLADVMSHVNAQTAFRVKVVICTNSEAGLAVLRKKFEAFAEWVTFRLMEHLADPFMLTWETRVTGMLLYASEKEYSHFVYLEDDECFTMEMMRRWLLEREKLRHIGMIPGLLRYELDVNREVYSTDALEEVGTANRVVKVEGKNYYHPANPYCGMFVLDRQLFDELTSSKRLTLGGCPANELGTREHAAAGLMLENVPREFTSRYLVACCECCGDRFQRDVLLFHIPCNYVGGPHFGRHKIPLCRNFNKRGRMDVDEKTV